MRSTHLFLSIVVVLTTSAIAQTRTAWTDEEQAFNQRVQTTLYRATPKDMGKGINGTFHFIPTAAYYPTFDSLNPLVYEARVTYRPPNFSAEQSGHLIEAERINSDIIYQVNPKDQISFDLTNGFEILDFPNTAFAIRGNQNFNNTVFDTSYTGSYTAIFLGRFEPPKKPVKKIREAPGQQKLPTMLANLI